jgi:hypothetical protein
VCAVSLVASVPSNEVRLWPSVTACNLGSRWRRQEWHTHVSMTITPWLCRVALPRIDLGKVALSSWIGRPITKTSVVVD